MNPWRSDTSANSGSNVQGRRKPERVSDEPASFVPLVVVIGCGRGHRCDDQLGLLVARRLVLEQMPETRIRESEAPGIDLLTEMEDASLLVIIDAAQTTPSLPAGDAAKLIFGAERRGEDILDVLAVLPGGATTSGHLLGVGEALQTGRALGILPSEVWIYVVGGVEFGYGDTISPQVERSVEPVALQIAKDIRTWRRRNARKHA